MRRAGTASSGEAGSSRRISRDAQRLLGREMNGCKIEIWARTRGRLQNRPGPPLWTRGLSKEDRAHIIITAHPWKGKTIMNPHTALPLTRSGHAAPHAAPATCATLKDNARRSRRLPSDGASRWICTPPTTTAPISSYDEQYASVGWLDEDTHRVMIAPTARA